MLHRTYVKTNMLHRTYVKTNMLNRNPGGLIPSSLSGDIYRHSIDISNSYAVLILNSYTGQIVKRQHPVGKNTLKIWCTTATASRKSLKEHFRSSNLLKNYLYQSLQAKDRLTVSDIKLQLDGSDHGAAVEVGDHVIKLDGSDHDSD